MVVVVAGTGAPRWSASWSLGRPRPLSAHSNDTLSSLLSSSSSSPGVVVVVVVHAMLELLPPRSIANN